MLATLILSVALGQCPNGTCPARVSRPQLVGAIRIEERRTVVYAAPQAAVCRVATRREAKRVARETRRAFRGCGRN